MNAPPDSWWVGTNLTDDSRIDMSRSAFSSPGTPKTYSTPSASRHFMNRSLALMCRSHSPGDRRPSDPGQMPVSGVRHTPNPQGAPPDGRERGVVPVPAPVLDASVPPSPGERSPALPDAGAPSAVPSAPARPDTDSSVSPILRSLRKIVAGSAGPPV